MIDYENLNFGDVIFKVDAKLNAFTRRKISKVDENGVEWFRYNEDRYEYSIQEYTYIGRIECHVFGTVDGNEIDETKYFFSCDGYIDYLFKSDQEEQCYYSTREQAQLEIDKAMAKNKELDRD